ncbi:MAG: response regulator [Dehalococcoidia bacterium]|nr:response regulator [Dehalococcoidia bacterium]MDH5781148.1 response regulator [Dehalococcoidia bacterium]
MDRILLIHSDPKAADGLTFVLQRSGLGVVTVADGQQALTEINRIEPDLIVMAEALAKMNMQIRQICEAPIIILGEDKEERARIHFLESGADVYMTHPFNLRLLLAWIHSLLRRSKGIGKTEGSDVYG